MSEHHRVVIVGTGFSGIGMAVRLLREGQSDFVLLEAADDIGGTWRENRYPGCACDVPSRLYSFSFAQNPTWSRDYAPAAEIWDYLRHVAEEHGVVDRVVTGADVIHAHWDPHRTWWTVGTRDGRRWTADSLVLGVGALHVPARPDIAGLDDFTGPAMHTAQWPEADGLDGKRVAVIGTGASAIQLVPALAGRAAHVTVFQPTAPWIMPKQDRPWSPGRQRRFTDHPWLQRLVRWRTYAALEGRVLGFAMAPRFMRVAERVSLRHLHDSVADPGLRARLRPQGAMSCKRVVLSDDYWPALTRPDVTLETDPIARVESGAVVTARGTRHEVDAIALATGFDVEGSFTRLDVTGIDGRTLRDEWSEGMASNLGITIAGFPELYVLLGPNTGLGHTSVVLMIEFAIDYVAECLRREQPMVLRDEAQQRFTAEMRRRHEGTVWASGCRSWYLDRFGNDTVIWPGSTIGYWRRTRSVDDADFVPVPAPRPHEEVAG